MATPKASRRLHKIPFEWHRKVIQLGKLNNIKDYRTALERLDYTRLLRDGVVKMLTEVKCSSTKTSIGLIFVTTEQLGFPKGAKHRVIYSKALRWWGLRLCPAEVGLVLGLDVCDNLMNQYTNIAMEPISGSFDVPHIFQVSRDYGCDSTNMRLEEASSSPDSFSHASNQWVFVAPHELWS